MTEPMLTDAEWLAEERHHNRAQSGERYASLVLADVARALADETATAPGIVYRADGRGLLYANATNGVASTPGEGKTTFACIAARTVLDGGQRVLFLDYEDSPPRIARRLVALGARAQQVIDGLLYPEDVGPLTPADVDALLALVNERNVGLTVLDGVAEALAAHGLDESSNADYAKWHGAVPRRLAQGSAVLLCDHVSKLDGGLWPRGAGHKLGAIDGAAYSLTAPTPFSRTSKGVIQLRIAKDREGSVGAKREIAARILIEPRPYETIAYRIEAPLFDGLDESPDGKLTEPFLAEVCDAIDSAHRADGRPLSRRRVYDELRSRAVRFDDSNLTPALLRLARDERIVRIEGANDRHTYTPIVVDTV